MGVRNIQKPILAVSTPARQPVELNTSIGSSSTKRRLQLKVEDKIEQCKSLGYPYSKLNFVKGEQLFNQTKNHKLWSIEHGHKKNTMRVNHKMNHLHYIDLVHGLF